MMIFSLLSLSGQTCLSSQAENRDLIPYNVRGLPEGFSIVKPDHWIHTPDVTSAEPINPCFIHFGSLGYTKGEFIETDKRSEDYALETLDTLTGSLVLSSRKSEGNAIKFSYLAISDTCENYYMIHTRDGPLLADRTQRKVTVPFDVIWLKVEVHSEIKAGQGKDCPELTKNTLQELSVDGKENSIGLHESLKGCWNFSYTGSFFSLVEIFDNLQKRLLQRGCLPQISIEKFVTDTDAVYSSNGSRVNFMRSGTWFDPKIETSSHVQQFNIDNELMNLHGSILKEILEEHISMDFAKMRYAAFYPNDPLSVIQSSPEIDEDRTQRSWRRGRHLSSPFPDRGSHELTEQELT